VNQRTRSVSPHTALLRAALVGLLALGTTSGCASYRGSSREVSSAALAEEPGWVRLDRVKLVRQKGSRDCGSAALSTVLEYYQPHGPASLDRAAIDAALREEPGRGLAAGQLRDYARTQGFDAFVIQGAFADLTHEIDEGRPVIVGVHKPLSSGKALAHYEVFIGYHPDQRQVLTLDPARGLRQFDVDGFMEEWEGAGLVTLVVMPKESSGSGQARAGGVRALSHTSQQ
jgi:ABC-type bacteriocin/lantibiotic exporter with double-glycine peptidase domain